MSEIEIVNNIKRALYTLVTQYYNTYMSDKSELNKKTYQKVLDLYKKINKCRSLNEINGYLEEIKKEYSSLKELYLSKVAIYEKMDKKEQSYEAAVLMGEIKDVTKIAQVLNDMYSQTKALISRMSPKKTKKTTKTEKPKEEGKEEKSVVKEKPVVTEKKTLNVDGVDFKNPIVNALHKLTEQIIGLKNRLAKMDPVSKEAIEVRKKINELSDRRMDIANKLFSNDGINYIRNIESLETRLAHLEDVKSSGAVSVCSEKYIEDLDELITIISDLRFFGEESKYIENKDKFEEVYQKYYDKFINYINSLFGEKNPNFYSFGDYNISISDLMSYFSVYNLRGGYQSFKDHHKTGKLGNEAISKEMYASGLDKIEGFITSLKEKASELLKTKGGKITIKDSSVSKDDIRFEIDSKMVDLYKVICSRTVTKNSGVSL